jgi:osmotically-inducible protein OsmY
VKQVQQSQTAQPSRQIAEQVRRGWRDDPRLGPAFHLDRVELQPDGALLLEGNVETLAQKKLALLRAASVPGVGEIVDRVRLIPQEEQRHIRSRLSELLAREPDFAGFRICEDIASGVVATDFQPVAAPEGAAPGEIDIEVNDGVVTLNGTVPSLVHKRLVGVIAWRVPGVRDVIDGIAVDPAEEDGPDQIEESVTVALDRNLAVDAAQIRVGVRGRVVRLTGIVPSAAMSELAEQDAWAVLGVNEVINEIESG